MPVTKHQLRKGWKLAFEYDEAKPPCHFRIYTHPLAPKLTMAHVIDKRTGSSAKTDIQFRSHGRKLATLADAIREHNAQEKRQALLHG